MRVVLAAAFVLSASCASGPSSRAEPSPSPTVTLPPHALGPQQRVAHLLNRAAFGPSPEDVARVQSMGEAAWLAEQLSPDVDADVAHRLSGFKTLTLSVAEAFHAYPPVQQRLKDMGVDPKKLEGDEEARERLKKLIKENKEELPVQLLVEATQAKLIRAVQSKRQLEEVLVDFWFNHFNVSAEKNRARWMVTAFERDAIRPHVFGRFRDLLGATAKHPAMLWYLDNWMSVRDGFEPPKGLPNAEAMPRGLNENYARELLELHTLGVNAGYTQDDVREAARALTGWTIEVRPKSQAFGQFLFRPRVHDDGEKHVFGLTLPAGGGQADGEKLLDYLARHPATARHVAKKLCVRFVSDAPPDALVERVAAEFLRTDGDLRATVRAIFEAPEFWSAEAVGAKTKTPLEFVVSAVRAVGTLDEVQRALAQPLEALGQPLYRCAPPTGYAEVAGPWVSAGALVSRINFGLRLATGRVPGVLVELPAAQPTTEATLDAVALRVLGHPPTPATRASLLRALAARDTEAVDEVRAASPALIAGLLLGSPDFQKQ
ncbi:MAG: DUF1800 domain-containing protein [Myxococcota bacterium]